MKTKSKARKAWEQCKVEDLLEEEGYVLIRCAGSDIKNLSPRFHLLMDKPVHWIALRRKNILLVQYLPREPTEQDIWIGKEIKKGLLWHPMRIYYKGAFGGMLWKEVK